MHRLLESIAVGASSWLELRYHQRNRRRIVMRSGVLEESSSVFSAGVGVRTLVDGVFGFASTTEMTREGIRAAVAVAQAAARASAGGKMHRVPGLADAQMARGVFPVSTDDPIDAHPLEEKLELVRQMDARVRDGSDRIVSSSVGYEEIQDEKIIVTSDGASAHIFDAKPEFRVFAIAARGEDQTMGRSSAGVTGGWADLFSRRSAEEMADEAVKLAVDQLSATAPAGGAAIVVLDPELVGLLSHEAIGHTVEADIALSGAVTTGKIGNRVASELVTLCDSGSTEGSPFAVGTMPVDDEGVLTRRIVVIENGVLRSFLHNRESAARFGVEPTGNARAFTYSDDPIIRMRNTYIERGETAMEDLIGDVREGFLLRGLGFGGQADSNGEFMFGVREGYAIRDGRIGKPVRGATVSGNAFDVLESVDAVGNDFEWDNSSGYCGKGQPAKVAAGGPHLRCRATIGGRQT